MKESRTLMQCHSPLIECYNGVLRLLGIRQATQSYMKFRRDK